MRYSRGEVKTFSGICKKVLDTIVSIVYIGLMETTMIKKPMDIRVRDASKELVKELRHIALEEDLSLNSLVKRILEDYCEKHSTR